jgi:putative transposase
VSELFKNKYRIASARLQTLDYAANAMYFITICTANRECFFGNVVETQCIASLTDMPEPEYEMQLNDLGKIVEMEWLKTTELRPDMNLELGEYVVMPNHFHAIILIGDNQFNTAVYENRINATVNHGNEMNDYSNNDQKNKFGPQTKNLASVLRGFKSAVTTYARKNTITFDWQARFHDHIISTNNEYLRIADYIVNNPNSWLEDKFYLK